MSNARIMIVEDERITAESLKCTLEDLGYVVCAIVATGAAAVAKAATELPDLVLMDIVLRGPMDGIEAAERIRSAHGTPIVYATAYADEPFLRRAKVTAPYGYIIKPFTTRELHSNIEMALHKSRLDRQIARLNAVLDTVRRVNQLIVREDSRDRLLQGVCTLLVAQRGYTFAWVAQLDEDRRLTCAKQAGLAEEQFQPLVDLLVRGDYPTCIRKTLVQPASILVGLRELDCPDCPLRYRYACDQALIVRLGYGGHCNGWLCAGVPATFAVDETEQGLFGEVADDISVALHALDAEARRDQTEQALRHAQKMEAIGQLAAGVAHDFNNLLTAISGYAELAGELLPPEHQARTLLRGIEVAAQHGTGVTRGLLTFSGRSASQKEIVGLAHLVGESAKLLRHLLPARIQLELDVPEGAALTVRADPTQLHQVLMNLAVNARDAMPDGGRLRIALSAARGAEPRADIRSGTTAPPMACISVSDTGVGMTPEIQARMFEPFFTTKPRGQGTGLGLAIIHSIVREHGGNLEVSSTPGAGSTFRMFLPSVTASTSDETQAAERAADRGHGETVLLAEDDRNVREILAAALLKQGYNVVQAADGAQLGERYAQHRQSLRLLLLDIDLPLRSGLDCLAAIRAGGDDVPAIVMTAARDAETGSLGPGDVLLHKPFRVRDLAHRVAQVVRTRQSKQVAHDPGD